MNSEVKDFSLEKFVGAVAGYYLQSYHQEEEEVSVIDSDFIELIAVVTDF